MAATRLRRLGLCLHAELFEVQVALDAAQDVVADVVAITQIEDRGPLGLDHRVANGAVLDQLLLACCGSAPLTLGNYWRSLACDGGSSSVATAGPAGRPHP